MSVVILDGIIAVNHQALTKSVAQIAVIDLPIVERLDLPVVVMHIDFSFVNSPVGLKLPEFFHLFLGYLDGFLNIMTRAEVINFMNMKSQPEIITLKMYQSTVS